MGNTFAYLIHSARTSSDGIEHVNRTFDLPSTQNEKINALFLYALKAGGEEFGAGIKMSVELGWLELHESGTYVRLLKDDAAGHQSE
ncbi:hypothetical protein [Bradyrhizobium sp. UFLA05-153]